jgi:Flp pilus assembly protein TadD
MQKALKLSFPTAELYEHLGDIHSKLGNNEDAKQAYRMALELEPERENVATKLNGMTE